MANGADFKREPFKFISRGLDWSRPVDLLPPDKYRVLDNVRPLGNGQIWQRQGQKPAWNNVFPGPVHSLKRLNDPVPSPFEYPAAFHAISRLAGSGTEVFIGFNATTNPDEQTTVFNGDAGYSGNPLSFCIVRPDLSPRPWCFIGDSLQMRKANSAGQFFNWGVPTPNQAPTAVVGAAVTDGPNGDYVYRYRARTSAGLGTGAVSNPGPPMRQSAAVTASNQLITVTVPALEPDPQVRWFDIFRFGGTLPEWHLVGSVTNAAGLLDFVDVLSDAAIADSPLLDFDNFQPFPTVDQAAHGFCSVAGTTVTRTGGTPFDTRWAAGSAIIIQGFNTTTLYRRPDDANTLEITDDLGTIAATDFLLPSPQLLAQPLPHVWGPFGGGATGVFLFAVGDPLRPGAVYWTKGNNPEAAPDTNVLDITSPSEPLQNGVMYDGKSFVFSTDRAFQMLPSFGQISDFVALEIPNSKGLFAPWAVAVGPKIWFRARDGIYETTGSGEFRSITDVDLYPLFPHEDLLGTFAIDGLANVTPAIVPPDDSRPDQQRLTYVDGLLLFDYLDQNGNYNTLVYHTGLDAWISRDFYAAPAVCHYLEEGSDIHNLLMGTHDKLVMKAGSDSDNGVEIAGHVRTGARDMGDPRPRKYFGDLQIDYDTNCSSFDVDLGFDNYTYFSNLALTGVNLTGRRKSIGDINGGLGQYAFNIGLDVKWSSKEGFPKLYFWEPSYLVKPEVTAKRATDWTDDGYPGDKWVQGCVIRADTLARPRTVDIQGDGGVVERTLAINHAIEQEKPYTFTPFVSHMLRLHPTDANFSRIEAVRWIWEPHPELALNWVTQETSLDMDGFFFHRDGYIALLSTAVVTLVVTADNMDFTYTIPSTGGLYDRPYIVFQPMKCRMVNRYSLTSPAGFRLFQRDCEIRVGQWGRQGPMAVRNPFGDISRIKGAAI